jgi:hypothetical protein
MKLRIRKYHKCANRPSWRGLPAPAALLWLASLDATVVRTSAAAPPRPDRTITSSILAREISYSRGRPTRLASSISCLVYPLLSSILEHRLATTPNFLGSVMEGYTKLATLMGAYPEVAILRRFAALNIKNILYLHAELADLEARLKGLEDEDKDSGDVDRRDCGFDWYTLRHYGESEEPVQLPHVSTHDESPGSSFQPPHVTTNGRRPESGQAAPAHCCCSCCQHEERSFSLNRNPRWVLVTEIREKLKEYSS